MKAPQRREREIARTREDIVDAASRAFVEIGVHDATMQDIAAEAGYTAASLYTYFRSKQEIVEAVLDQLTAEFLQVFEQPLPSNLTFPQRFEILLVRQLELVEKRRALMLTFHSAEAESGHCPGDSHGQSFHENFERRIRGLADWMRKNAKPEELGGHDPEWWRAYWSAWCSASCTAGWPGRNRGIWPTARPWCAIFLPRRVGNF